MSMASMSMASVELEQLRIAEQVARLGSYTWDLETNDVTWSTGLFRLLGVDDKHAKASVALWLAHVHPEDRERAGARVNDKAEKTLSQLEYRMITDTEREIWVRVRSRPVEISGRSFVVGVAFDVTPQIRARMLAEDLREQLVGVNQQLLDTVELLERERNWPSRH